MSGLYIVARNFAYKNIANSKVQTSNDGPFSDTVAANDTTFKTYAGVLGLHKFTFTASAKHFY